MSFVTVIFKRLWGCILGFFGFFKHLMCRSQRGRKNSGSILPMTTDHLANTANIQHPVPSNNVAELELESWESWGMEDVAAGGSSNNMHGFHTSQGGGTKYPPSRSNSESEKEPGIDFFEDMTPQFRKAAKILIKKKENYVSGTLSSRLTMATDIPPASRELESWEDGENAWGDEANEDLSWEAEKAIREKKQWERERRLMEHQRKKLEKEAQKASRRDFPQLTAVKLS